MFSQQQLQKDLQQLGLTKGDTVYVHTSLKAIGAIDGGADTLIKALCEVLGEEGTFAVPTHSLCFPGNGSAPYNAATSPSRLGVFTEVVRNHPQALRSGHASHSTAAIGKNAKKITENHDPCHAVGENSPLYRLWKMGGKILLLGVTHKVSTCIHLAESVAKSPYLHLHYDASWGNVVHEQLPDGSIKEHTQIEFPGCSGTFNQLQPLLEAKGQVAVGKIGNATSYLMNAADLIACAVDLMEKDNAAMLCDSPTCPACPDRKEACR